MPERLPRAEADAEPDPDEYMEPSPYEFCCGIPPSPPQLEDEDAAHERRLLALHKKMIKEQLRGGKNVCYRLGKVWSMVPDPPLPDQCTFAPVTENWQVKKNDIVLCEVQPENSLVENRVLWTSMDLGRTASLDMLKGLNGWCYIDHIFGKLVDAPPRPRDLEWPDLEPLVSAPAAY